MVRHVVLLLVVLVALAAAADAAPVMSLPAGAPDRPIDPGRVAGKSVLVVPIHGEIGTTMVYFVKRSLRRAEAENVGVILFDFDTPGGDMGSMIEICTLLARTSIPTIGYVNPMAGSAGAIILSGVNSIYMSESSVVGEAALVATGPEGGIVELPPRVLEKYNSFIRAQVRTLAERNGHPFPLFQAMIDQEIEVREVFVDGRREIMTAEEIGNLQVKLQAGEVHDVRVGEIICPKGKLLTLTNLEAEKWGLSRRTVPTRAALLQRIGLGGLPVEESTSTWADHLSRFLTNPIVVLFLMVVGAIGIYIELNTPGVWVPGLVGISAFALIFLGQYAAGLAGILEPILFLVGVLLLAVEIFVIPGFGVAGVVGIALILGSLILAGQDFVVPRTDFEQEAFQANLATVFGGLILSTVAVVLLARYLPRTRTFQLRLALERPLAAAVHASGVPDLSAEAAPGQAGRAMSILRPAGRARFGDRYLDVVSEGQFIEPGVPIEVLRVEGNRVIVRPVKKTEETQT